MFLEKHIECETDAVQIGRKCYYDSKKSSHIDYGFYESRRYCLSRGSTWDLATIDNKQENEAMSKYMLVKGENIFVNKLTLYDPYISL